MNLATVLVAAATATSVAASDPFLWLEDVEGERAIAWVRAQNDRSLGELTKDPRYQRFYAAALAIAEDKSRIPSGTPRAGWVYNFWQDDQNVRGLWRRTSIESYRKA
ncbi:MAG: S9 family peptidase, partial [Steroidobacteraceae bacterium]